MKVILALFIIMAAGGLFWFANQSNEAALSTESTQLPVISRQEILDATDLVDGVKLAVIEDDNQAIERWLEKAIELAKTAGLSQQDINYLQSDMAEDYVIFQAKRSLFNDALEKAYYGLNDIETAKNQFPEAQDLFSKADALIAARDNIIQQIATEMAEGIKPSEQDISQARTLWKKRVNANANITLPAN